MNGPGRPGARVGEVRADGRVPVRFSWRGPGAPALWCPALGGPGLRPMRPDSEEPGCWKLDALLPAGASISWAIVPDARPLRDLIPGEPGAPDGSAAPGESSGLGERGVPGESAVPGGSGGPGKLGMPERPGASNGLGALGASGESGAPGQPAEPAGRPDPERLLRAAAALDAALVAERAVAPSLFRLIGGDPVRAAEPNIAVLELPGARSLDWAAVRAPAPVMRERCLPDGRILVSAHRAVLAEDGEPDLAGTRLRAHQPAPADDGAPVLAGAGDEPQPPGRAGAGGRAPVALLLDGEVLLRCAGEIERSGVAACYLRNRGPAERLGDYADPVAFAAGVAPQLTALGARIVVGASAAAPAALALALALGAPAVLLLSPVFGSREQMRELVAAAARSRLRLDVRAGSEERGPAAARQQAQLLGEVVASAGGQARVRVFPGGHDLAAWRAELLDALAAFAVSADASGVRDSERLAGRRAGLPGDVPGAHDPETSMRTRGTPRS